MYKFDEDGGQILINQLLNKENGFLLGEDFVINNFNYRVIDFEYSKSISNSFLNETARGYYLIVKVELTNLDYSNQRVDDKDFIIIKIIKDKLYEFNLAFNPTYVANSNPENSIYSQEGFPPLISIPTSLVFEVPSKDGFYSFVIYDTFNKKNFKIVRLISER